MRYPKILITSLAAAALFFAMLPPHKAEAAKLAGRHVKIGCLVSLTGKGADWGVPAKVSMQIAVEEINAKGGVGGVPIDLICYDTQTSAAEALSTISRLVDSDKVLAISGPCFSSEFETIAPQLDARYKTVIDSFCSAKPGLSAISKWGFRNTLTSDKLLKPAVAAWLKEYHPKKVVIIYDAEDAVSQSEGTKVLPAIFAANGIEVLALLSYRTGDTDYSAQVTKAKSLGAEGIGLGSCYQNAGAIAKEMQKQGLNVPIVGGACAGAQGFIDIAGKAAEGAYMASSAWLSNPRPDVQAYVKKVVPLLGGHEPAYSGPRAYDNIASFKYCIENSGVTNKPDDLDSDRNKIRECLSGLKHFPGVAGEITFDENRDGEGSPTILKVVDGKYVSLAK